MTEKITPSSNFHPIKINYFFFFFLLLNSCKHDVAVDLPPFEEKLVVESYIVQGDSVFIIRIDKTVNPIIKSYPIMFDTNFSGTTAVLSFNNTNYELRQIVDYREERQYNILTNNHGRLFVLNKKVEYVSNMKLIVDYRSYHVESECNMLPVVHIKKASFTGVTNNAEFYSSFKVNVEADFPSGISFYMIRIMPTSFVAINDPGAIKESARGYFIVNKEVSNKEFIFTNPFYSLVGEFSDYTIILSRIEKTHYDFAISSLTQFEELNTMIPTETTEVPSNIQGGYGIFTAMSNDTIRVKIQ
jgi:hypothetical protein